MIRPSSPETTSILHTLDLGEHTLFILDDGGVDLRLNDERMSSLADDRVSLDCEETYRLFISLQAQFRRSPSSVESLANVFQTLASE